MIRLVENIISLSHLDEGADDMQRENIDLYTLAEKVIQSLVPQANTVCVALELSGVPGVLNGVPHDFIR